MLSFSPEARLFMHRDQAAISFWPNHTQRLLRPWLWVAIAALAVAGIYSVLLVAGRSPGVSNIVGVKDLFGVALVVHVDLSVLLWFLAMLSSTWALWVAERSGHWLPELVLKYAVGCFAGAVVCLAVSPWNGGEFITSNYVPMLTNGLFYLGLSLLLAGVLLALAGVVLGYFLPTAHEQPALPLPWETFGIGAIGGAWIVFGAVAALLWSFPQLSREAGNDHAFFESLYWGSGHVLQYAFAQLAMTIWLLLAGAVGLTAIEEAPWTRWLLALNALLAVLALPIYLFHTTDSAEFVGFFTQHMRMVGGLAPGLLILALLWFLPRWRGQLFRNALAAALGASIFMFIVGGVLGHMIAGINVTIPAHYHGAIVGITIATMGFIYWLLPRLGYADVTTWRSARWQPWIYAGGQLFHVLGLAVSGGYGMLRKTPGQFAPGLTKAKISMGVMGAGGGIAIIGGLLFVIICIRAMRRNGLSRT